MTPQFSLLLLLAAAAVASAAPALAPKVPCIESCSRRPNGDYQSCLGCHVYATCTDFVMVDNRPCPGNLLWNENLKRCHWSSPTCPKNVSVVVTADEQLRTVGGCIRSCEGLGDGDYPSCSGCQFYASCSNGHLVDHRPCPAGLFWDDGLKKCGYSSSSCSVSSSTMGSASRCIRSCEGLTNGDYQSCEGCDVFASCVDGVLHDRRPCPEGLVWDDLKKRCEHTSTTCSAVELSSFRPTGRPACVKSCTGLRDGNYHSCNGCRVFASCTNGYLIDNRPCPARLVWNDFARSCLYWSSTCPTRPLQTVEPVGKTQEKCVSSCVGVANGNYASCLNCSVFASCSNGALVDGRPCPSGLLWDDQTKSCSLTSSTCTKDSSTTTTPNPETPPAGTVPSETPAVTDGTHSSTTAVTPKESITQA